MIYQSLIDWGHQILKRTLSRFATTGAKTNILPNRLTRHSQTSSPRSHSPLSDRATIIFNDFGSSVSVVDLNRLSSMEDMWIKKNTHRYRCSAQIRAYLPIRKAIEIWRSLASRIVRISNFINEICLSREVTIFPGSKKFKFCGPDYNLLGDFSETRFETWYNEWVQNIAQRIIRFMGTPLLLCTCFQFIQLTTEGIIFVQRAIPVLRVRWANWSPLQGWNEPSIVDIS